MKRKIPKISVDEWKPYRDSAWKAIMAADYKKALGILAPVYKKYPTDFKVVYFYASTLADYGEFLTPAQRMAYKKRGCLLLYRLLKRMRGISRPLGYATRNEYYYHSGKFDKQYCVGVERVGEGDKGGYYSQGVGAAWHALNHAKNGRPRFAGLWAKRAVRAWESFFRFKADYYNAYVHYALALGILGRVKDMEAALSKSAKLSGKPQSYREFKEVRDNIAILGRPNLLRPSDPRP